MAQEKSAQKQKHSNIKSTGVCQEGGKKGPGSVEKRGSKKEKEIVLKISFHYQQPHTPTHLCMHTHTHVAYDHS